MTPFHPRAAAFCVVAVGVGAAIAAIVRPLRESSWKTSCQTNLKQIGLATMQYTRDYDERWMLAGNWKNALEPYGKFYRQPTAYSCPKTARAYAYNGNLSGNFLQSVSSPATLALFYEAANGINADSGQNWTTSGVHDDGSNVGFADGHVKWLQKKPAFWQASLLNKSKIAAARAAWWRNFEASEKRRRDWIQKHAKKR